MFGTKSQKKTFFFTPSLNKPCVLFVIFIWPQECSTTSKLHSSLPNLETGCSSPSLAAAIFSLALLNASSTEFTLGKRVTELMMMMEAVRIKVVIMDSVMSRCVTWRRGLPSWVGPSRTFGCPVYWLLCHPPKKLLPDQNGKENSGFFKWESPSHLMDHVQGDGDMTTRNGWET